MNQTPAEVIEIARLASDPLRHLGTLRVREALRRWLESGAGHECSIKLRRAEGSTELLWCVDLLVPDGCVASALSREQDDAIAHALSTVLEAQS